MSLPALQRYLAEEKSDVVHAHLSAAGLLARMVRLLGRRVPLIYTEHNVPSGYRPVARWLNCLSRPLFNEVIFVSSLVERSWRRCPRPVRSSVIRNGIAVQSRGNPEELRREARRRLGLGPDQTVIGTVGSLVARKDQEVLLRACANFVGGLAPTVVLVGEGPLRDDLRRLASQLGIGRRLVLLGAREDVRDLLPGFDLFVLSSRVEGLPIALLEAMACGLPCIATSVGGIPEVIEDGVSGLMTLPGDPMALHHRIWALLIDPDLRRRLGSAARERILQEFTASQMTRRYQVVYERAAADIQHLSTT